MLEMLDGAERTEQEFKSLFEVAGLQLNLIIPPIINIGIVKRPGGTNNELGLKKFE